MVIIAQQRQVGGGTRYLIGAAAARAAIRADRTMVDAGLASIIVDRKPDGTLWAQEWPERAAGGPPPWARIEDLISLDDEDLDDEE